MSCTDNKTEIRGWYMWIRECATQAGVFWRVLCDGPIEWTTPLFDLNGGQKVSGCVDVHDYLGLAPTTQPSAPATGCRLYVDDADQKLKAKLASGTIVVIGGP